MSKTSSVAKTKANRRNSLQSTGPKSIEGKQEVKWNAQKHGLLSKEIIIRSGDGVEKQSEYNALVAGLRLDLVPVGTLEEMLVERIAVCYWRLRRVLRAEAGEMRLRTDSARWTYMFELKSKFQHNEKYMVLDSNREEFEQTSFGQEQIIENLRLVRSEVLEKGYITVETLRDMAKFHGTGERSIVLSLGAISSMAMEGLGLRDHPESVTEPIPEPAKCKKILLKLIDETEKIHDRFHEEFEQMEELEHGARLMSFSLPPQESIDRILRYETAIERQLYKAIDQLERVQRSRGGQPTIPPINVNLTTGD